MNYRLERLTARHLTRTICLRDRQSSYSRVRTPWILSYIKEIKPFSIRRSRFPANIFHRSARIQQLRWHVSYIRIPFGRATKLFRVPSPSRSEPSPSPPVFPYAPLRGRSKFFLEQVFRPAYSRKLYASFPEPLDREDPVSSARPAVIPETTVEVVVPEGGKKVRPCRERAHFCLIDTILLVRRDLSTRCFAYDWFTPISPVSLPIRCTLLLRPVYHLLSFLAVLFFSPSRVPLSVSLAIVSSCPGHEQWLRNSKTYLVEFTRYCGRRTSDWHFSKHRPGKWNSVIESSASIRRGCGARSMACS